MRPNGAVRQDWIRAMAAVQRRREPTLATAIAHLPGEADALVGEHGTLSYAALRALANQWSHWALREGVAAGEVVGLLMPNASDYVAIWLGLTQVGCVAALLNTHIQADALAHCVAASGARHVIAAASLAHLLPPSVCGWDAGAPGLPGTPPPPRTPAASDTALLIYTSGTTGLPKAARVSHARVLEWSDWFAGMMDARPDDRLYDCLPMYHSVGGVVAVGAMLVAGGAVVVRERFSARRFWDDVAAERCTVVQYIGELCRYLLQSFPHPLKTSHRLRLACGNGLRGEVWEPFQRRFAIPQILEFYAATEGAVSLYNAEGKPGAIGRVPAFLAHRFPVALVRCDPAGQPLRDAGGHCLACAADEPGEALGRFTGPVADAYTDPAASAAKVLHDVFAPGDRWFRTGDLMRRDARGYFFFLDRIGDTFRWKGENVSTTEVAAVVAACPGVREAVVYGVAIPGAEGRAGMAAVSVQAGFDWTALRAHLHSQLPGYARPLFVRVVDAIAHTGTFKPRKDALAAEGLDGPAIWFDGPGGFVRLDAAWRRRIADGMRL